MEIYRHDQRTIGIRDLDVFSCELLNQIAVSADPTGSDAATKRIYTSPTHGREPEFDEEWLEYVTPDLKHCFESALSTVTSDLTNLRAIEDEEDGFELLVPVSHLEAWIHSLNQARLVLAERYQFGEKEMERMPMSGDIRALALYQIHLYGFLQERFLQELAS